MSHSQLVEHVRELERGATAQAEANAADLRLLAEYKEALDAHSIVAITDRRGIITYVNDKFCEISKYSREELLGEDHRIINSGHHSKDFFRELWSTIGRGYIMKQEGGKRIMEGIRQVASGHTFVSPSVSAKIIESFSGHGSDRSPVSQLTDREFEVFRLIGEGLGTKEMAEKLRVSVKTIEVHRVNIKEKLHTQTASELIRYAVRWVEAQGKTDRSD